MRFDFSLLTSDEGLKMLKKNLILVLQSIGEKYNIKITNDNVKSTTFNLIILLAVNNENVYKQVVILIDKYDSPLLNVIGIMNYSNIWFYKR